MNQYSHLQALLSAESRGTAPLVFIGFDSLSMSVIADHFAAAAVRIQGAAQA